MIIGAQFSMFNFPVYSGFIKDADAPVSIRKRSGRPNGDEMFM